MLKNKSNISLIVSPETPIATLIETSPTPPLRTTTNQKNLNLGTDAPITPGEEEATIGTEVLMIEITEDMICHLIMTEIIREESNLGRFMPEGDIIDQL